MNLHFQVICLFLKFCQLSEDENFIWGHDPQYSVVDTHSDYHVSKGPNGSYFVFTSNFEILPNILTPPNIFTDVDPGHINLSEN